MKNEEWEERGTQRARRSRRGAEKRGLGWERKAERGREEEKSGSPHPGPLPGGEGGRKEKEKRKGEGGRRGGRSFRLRMRALFLCLKVEIGGDKELVFYGGERPGLRVAAKSLRVWNWSSVKLMVWSASLRVMEPWLIAAM